MNYSGRAPLAVEAASRASIVTQQVICKHPLLKGMCITGNGSPERLKLKSPVSLAHANKIYNAMQRTMAKALPNQNPCGSNKGRQLKGIGNESARIDHDSLRKFAESSANSTMGTWARQLRKKERAKKKSRLTEAANRNKSNMKAVSLNGGAKAWCSRNKLDSIVGTASQPHPLCPGSASSLSSNTWMDSILIGSSGIAQGCDELDLPAGQLSVVPAVVQPVIKKLPESASQDWSNVWDIKKLGASNALPPRLAAANQGIGYLGMDWGSNFFNSWPAIRPKNRQQELARRAVQAAIAASGGLASMANNIPASMRKLRREWSRALIGRHCGRQSSSWSHAREIDLSVVIHLRRGDVLDLLLEMRKNKKQGGPSPATFMNKLVPASESAELVNSIISEWVHTAKTWCSSDINNENNMSKLLHASAGLAGSRSRNECWNWHLKQNVTSFGAVPATQDNERNNSKCIAPKLRVSVFVAVER